MQFKEKRRKNINLDITPLVDTVFNLLIFFALSLNFTSVTSSLNISLPKISTKDIQKKSEQTTIQITQSREVFVNKTRVPLEALSEMLAKVLTGAGSPSVIIQADERVPHGTVVQVMDICRKSGVAKISIAAQPH